MEEIVEIQMDDGVFPIELNEVEREFLREIQIEETGGLAAPAKIVVYRPFRGMYFVSQSYKPGTHPALDIAMPNKTKLYNPFPHQVVVGTAGYSTVGYAYYLTLLSHEYKLMSLFAHLTPGGFASGIKSGARVNVLQYVCLSNNTGNSTGPHLHYEIRKPPYNRGYADCVNFSSWLEPLPSSPPTPPPPTPPPTNGNQVLARATKRTSVYKSKSKFSSVLGHIESGEKVLVMDIGDPYGSDQDWVQIAEGKYAGLYAMERNKNKVNLVKA